jgi:hypothetical protein
LSDQLPGLPAGLDDLIVSALAKDPRERPASAGELIELAARAAAEPGAARSHEVESIGEPVEVVSPALESARAAAEPVAVTRVRTPNRKAMRVISRVAIVVPAISLTLLAVIAVLHADPLQRGPATGSARPASGRPTATSASAETAPLVPVQKARGGPQPSGRVELADDGGRRQLTVSAAHLPPERAEPRQAYAVWLFNSRHDADRVGFVVPPVSTGGHFESHQELPARAARYREVVVTLEDAAAPLPQGPIYLRAALPALTERSSGSLAR